MKKTIITTALLALTANAFSSDFTGAYVGLGLGGHFNSLKAKENKETKQLTIAGETIEEANQLNNPNTFAGSLLAGYGFDFGNNLVGSVQLEFNKSFGGKTKKEEPKKEEVKVVEPVEVEQTEIVVTPEEDDTRILVYGDDNGEGISYQKGDRYYSSSTEYKKDQYKETVFYRDNDKYLKQENIFPNTDPEDSEEVPEEDIGEQYIYKYIKDRNGEEAHFETVYEDDDDFNGLVIHHVDYKLKKPAEQKVIYVPVKKPEVKPVQQSKKEVTLKENYSFGISYLQGYQLDNFLPYVKAGLSFTSFTKEVKQASEDAVTKTSVSSLGLDLGLGARIAINDNFKVGAEYTATYLFNGKDGIKGFNRHNLGLNAVYSF